MARVIGRDRLPPPPPPPQVIDAPLRAAIANDTLVGGAAANVGGAAAPKVLVLAPPPPPPSLAAAAWALRCEYVRVHYALAMLALAYALLVVVRRYRRDNVAPRAPPAPIDRASLLARAARAVDGALHEPAGKQKKLV